MTSFGKTQINLVLPLVCTNFAVQIETIYKGNAKNISTRHRDAFIPNT